MRVTFIAVLLVLLVSGNALADHDTTLEASLLRKDYVAAIDHLRGQASANPESFIKHNHDYLLGRLYELSGRTAEALPLYQNVAERESPAAAYALVHLSRIMRESGNLLLERIYLDRLTVIAPEFSAAARINLARSAVQVDNNGLASLLLTVTGRGSSDRFLRDDTVLLAESYLRSGDSDRGHAILNRILESTPDPDAPDDAALAAVRAFDTIAPKAELAEADHLNRAKIYQFNREFVAAGVHYEAIINRFADGPNAPAAMLDIARGHSQLGEHGEALRWYERVQERYPDTNAAKDALLMVSGAYGRVGKYKEALTRYQRFIERYPADERLDHAYSNIVDTARDQADDREALKWAAKTREAFAGQYPEHLALFSEARIYISRGEWQNALEKLDVLAARQDLGRQDIPGAPTTPEVKFLRGFVLEQMDQHAAAIDQYLAIADGRNEYYGWRASERLKALAKIDAAQSSVAERVAENTAKLRSGSPEERRTAALAVIRLTESPDVVTTAMGVLREVFTKSIPQPAKAPHTHDDYLAVDPVDDRDTAASVATAEALWRKVPADYPVAMRDVGLRELYPAPYAHLIVQTANRYSVDPRLVLAIMRQESRFAIEAKSGSAARGLMQFVTSAATKTAAALGIKDLRNSDLNSPQISVLFGSYYLYQLGGLFPHQSEAVVASYNGGEDNVKRWAARSRSNDADRFVPEIQFAQTKDYVQKVMASYRVYRELYDQNLQPRGVTTY